MDTAYNVDIIGGSSGSGAIVNFNVTNAERLTAALVAAGVNHIRTGASFSVRDLVMIGAGAGTGGQLRYSGAGTAPVLVAPTWDQTLKIRDAFNGAATGEFWPYGIAVIDGSAAPISGLPFTLDDVSLNRVISTTTNSSGMISYGSGNTANCVKVVDHIGTAATYYGKWTARVNQGSGANPNYPSRTITFDWPTTATWLTGNTQYQDMFDIIQLLSPPGNPSSWEECELGA